MNYLNIYRTNKERYRKSTINDLLKEYSMLATAEIDEVPSHFISYGENVIYNIRSIILYNLKTLKMSINIKYIFCL